MDTEQRMNISLFDSVMKTQVILTENMQAIAKSLEIIADNMKKQNEMNDKIIEWMDKYPEFKEFMKEYNCCGYHD